MNMGLVANEAANLSALIDKLHPKLLSIYSVTELSSGKYYQPKPEDFIELLHVINLIPEAADHRIRCLQKLLTSANGPSEKRYLQYQILRAQAWLYNWRGHLQSVEKMIYDSVSPE